MKRLTLATTVFVSAALTAAGAAPARRVPIDVFLAGQHASAPRVAVDPQGNAVAVWQRFNGAGFVVQAADHRAGGVWQQPGDLSATRRTSAYAQVAVDAKGDAVVVWERSNANSNRRVQGATRAAGGAWRGPVDVSGAGRDASMPQVAVDGPGNAVAVWERSGVNHKTVQGTVRPAGAGWQAPVNLSVAGESASSAQVAVDQLGNAVAIWERDGAGGHVVRAAVRSAGAGWQAPVDVSAPSVERTSPQVAVDQRANAVAVWEHADATGHMVQGAVRPIGGPWQAPVGLSNAGQRAVDAKVAVDPQGNAVAVWQRLDASASVMQGTARPAGGSWQATVNLSAPVQGLERSRPQVAVDARGEAVAVWERHDGARFVIQAAMRPADGAWQAPTNLSTDDQDASDPQIAVDPQGNAVAVWERQNAAASAVHGAVRPAGGSWRASVDLSATRRLRLSPGTLRAARSGPSVKARAGRTGTRVSYALSLAARVRFTVQRIERGGRQRVRGSFIRRRRAGPDEFTFTGRLAGRALKPGRYRLVARPAATGFTGRSASVRFVVVR